MWAVSERLFIHFMPLGEKKYILVRVLWRNRTDRIKLYISKGDLLAELTGCALSSPVIAASD